MKCGIIDPRLLTLHHKNGDGAAHRKQILRSKGSYSTYTLYNSVVKGLESKKRYELLCYNCQQLVEYETGRIKMHLSREQVNSLWIKKKDEPKEIPAVVTTTTTPTIAPPPSP